jgi:hypothetical protein
MNEASHAPVARDAELNLQSYLDARLAREWIGEFFSLGVGHCRSSRTGAVAVSAPLRGVSR